MESVEPLEAFPFRDPTWCGVCGAPFTTGVGLGMEVKDHLYGNKADFVDFLLTAVGGAIGHGVMLAVGLGYVIGYLISLI